MSDKVQKFLEQLTPFILIGLGIALFISILFMFFYIAVWGLIIGGLLFIGSVVKQYLFPPKTTHKNATGRIIEHEHKK